MAMAHVAGEALRRFADRAADDAIGIAADASAVAVASFEAGHEDGGVGWDVGVFFKLFKEFEACVLGAGGFGVCAGVAVAESSMAGETLRCLELCPANGAANCCGDHQAL